MPEEGSYFSGPYAPAWGGIVGTVIGVPIGLAAHALWIVGILATLGLLIGYGISQIGRRSKKPGEPREDAGVEARLRRLEDLRTRSVISEEEYRRKREAMLSEL